MENNTLNGFDAFFDSLNPNVGKTDDIKTDDTIVDKDLVDASLTDEELAEILANSRESKKDKTEKKVTSPKEDEDPIEDPEDKIEPKKKKEETDSKDSKSDKDTKESKEDSKDEDEDDDGDDSEDDNNDSEANAITGFFDVLAEKLDWQLDEDEKKPQTAEELITYFQDIIEENSKPEYSNEEVAKLDKFVKEGGDLKKYLTIDAEIDFDELNITENADDQKLVLKEFLKEKGFSAAQISKKLSKYEDAGLLEDEAEDALEALKEIKTAKKEELLAKLENDSKQAKKQQQEFFGSVVNQITRLTDIRGIKIPEKDKKQLAEYMFKPDSDGLTKYQKDYAKDSKNLIESAYFTMKGDALLNSAKQEGNKKAIDVFKNSLKNSNPAKRSKKDIKQPDDNIWSSFTQHFRNA